MKASDQHPVLQGLRRAVAACEFRDALADIVTRRGASLRLGFKGRFAYLQAQWPGAEEALSLLRAENFDVVRYLTEAEESEAGEDEAHTGRPRRLQAERMELAFIAVEMRGEIDALVERTGCRPRLTNDGKRAWVCVEVEGEWVPVITCCKGNAPKRLSPDSAMSFRRPDVVAIRRGERRFLHPAKVPA